MAIQVEIARPALELAEVHDAGQVVSPTLRRRGEFQLPGDEKPRPIELIRPNEGGTVVVGVADIKRIQAALEELQTRIKRAMQLDKIEADKAKKEARWTDCAKKKAFDKRIQKIIERMTNALQRLSMVYGEYYVVHANVPESLMEQHKKGWDDFVRGVDQVLAEINERLKLDDWDSPGAAQYKAALPTQINAMTELRQLGVTSGEACEQVATLNGAIFMATAMSVDEVARNIDLREPRKVKRKWLFGSGNIFDLIYYYRTDHAASMVEQLTQWMLTMAHPDGSDWSPTALQLKSALKDVEASPNNLLPDGGWPESRAGETKEARVAALGDHRGQGQVKATKVQGAQGGTKW